MDITDMATKNQLEAQIAALEAGYAGAQEKLAEAQQNIRELQKALMQAEARKPKYGIPSDVRARYFAAHPDSKSASNQDILNWARNH